MKSCKNCSQKFEITAEDLAFYEKVSPKIGQQTFQIPPPTFCPDCRQQRRISWRNERSLYYRTCSATGKKIMAMYPEDSAFPVYDNDYWWSDQWDARDYARDYDFDRPFFEQLAELRDQVPHFALAVNAPTMENSDYVNHAGYLKNCYLIFNSDNAERCLYSKGTNRCHDCVDCYKVYESELLYECANCYNCYNCTYLQDSQHSSNCHLSSHLIGCKDTFLSTNLRNKQYYFLNKPLTKEQYATKLAEYNQKYTHQELLALFLDFKSQNPVKYTDEINTENCTGCYLVNCKNCQDCFDCEYLEDSKYCYDLKKGGDRSHTNYDISAFGMGVINCYEGGTVGYNANHVLFGENVWECSDVYYSLLCMQNSQNLFGCVGLQKQQYCIFNKQYTKEEYQDLVPRIIAQMQQAGEWGEFFPATMSPFAYNESVAQDYYPLTAAQATSQGFKWLLEDQEAPPVQHPDIHPDITAVSDDVLKFALTCQTIDCYKRYKIQPAELAFYRKMQLPIPKNCPKHRHQKRLSMRAPRTLTDRPCTHCQAPLRTPHSNPNQKILCAPCYQEAAN